MTSPASSLPSVPTRSLAGRTAVVTGSTSGIGLGIARALAGAGASVVLNGFGSAADIERLDQALQKQITMHEHEHPSDLDSAVRDMASLLSEIQEIPSP